MQHNVHLQPIALCWCFLSETGRWAAQGLNWISGARQRPPCDSWRSWTGGGALILVGHLHPYHPHHRPHPHHRHHHHNPHHRRQQCQHQDQNHLQQALLR